MMRSDFAARVTSDCLFASRSFAFEPDGGRKQSA